MALEENNNKKGKISSRIVDEIKKNDLKMKPSCYFVFSSFFWFGIGAIFFIISLMLLSFSVHYFYEYRVFDLIFLGYFSGWFLFPILVGLIGIVSIYVSSRFYRKGRICCRHEEWMLLSAISFVVVIGLFGLARSGPYENWRASVENNCIQNGIDVSSKRFWSNKEKGRIFGEIESINKKEESILIKGDQGDLLKIMTDDCDCKVDHENAEKGLRIKTIGKLNDQIFQAKQVWYWE